MKYLNDIIGSIENGTVRNGDFLAAIKNRLYLCSASEIPRHFQLRKKPDRFNKN